MATKATKQASPAKKAPASKSSETKKAAGAGKIKPKSDAADGLRELMVDSLKDIYWAEKTLLKAIPKMAKNATSANLINGLKGHLEETRGHVERLEQVFEMMGKKAQAKKCEAMAGLVKEAEEIMSETEPGVVRDAGIILAAQKVEHYEIATYGTLCAFAKALGEDEAGSVLHMTLEEEKAADQKLTDAAYNDINVEAVEA